MDSNRRQRPSEAFATLKAARVALDSGRDHDALELFTSVPDLPGAREPEIDASCFEGAALALRHLGQLDASRRLLNQGMEKYPGNVMLRFSSALDHLGHGNFSAGWPDYELRLKLPQRAYMARPVTFPRWRRETVRNDLKILIWSEQGFGDEIMFASLIPLFARANLNGTQITFECSRDCAPLFRRSLKGVEIVVRNFSGGMSDELAGREFDCELPLASIPFALGLDRIPAPTVPFILSLFPNEKGGTFFSGKRVPVIGLSWRGGTKDTRRAARSMEVFQFFDRLAALNPVQFVSLQHDAPVSEFEGIRRIHHFPELAKSLDGLASLVYTCDAIVTVCNTNVHLAGAMGKPVIVLAPHAPEWRYGFRQNSLPWYSNVAVIRQDIYGSWEMALAEAADMLKIRLSAQGFELRA